MHALDIGPQADGTLPEQGQRLLLGIGDWLKRNGEAICGTRPWLVYGEGPTRMAGGAFSEERDQKRYTARDLRFTRSKDGRALYVITLGSPEREFTISSMKVDAVQAASPLTGPWTTLGWVVSTGNTFAFASRNPGVLQFYRLVVP